MKKAAFRQGDTAHLRILVAHLRLGTSDALANVCERGYGPDSAVLPGRSELLWQGEVILERH